MAKAKRAQRTKKRETGESGQQVLTSLARRVQRVRQFEAAAGTYLAELAPFSLPPEGIEINARPDFYVTVVFLPDDPSWADARACLDALLEGKGQNGTHVLNIGAGKVATLFEEFALNLNYTLVRIPDKDGHWQVRQELAFGEHVVLLESRWDRTNRSTVQWLLRVQPRTSWIVPLSTLLISSYNSSLGLVLGRSGEDDGE